MAARARRPSVRPAIIYLGNPGAAETALEPVPEPEGDGGSVAPLPDPPVLRFAVGLSEVDVANGFPG
jgi:hypothetical protein